MAHNCRSVPSRATVRASVRCRGTRTYSARGAATLSSSTTTSDPLAAACDRSRGTSKRYTHLPLSALSTVQTMIFSTLIVPYLHSAVGVNPASHPCTGSCCVCVDLWPAVVPRWHDPGLRRQRELPLPVGRLQRQQRAEERAHRTPGGGQGTRMVPLPQVSMRGTCSTIGDSSTYV